MSATLRFALAAFAFLSFPMAVPVVAAENADVLWHKACAKPDDKATCFVEQFAIAQPNNVPVLHIRFDLQGGEGRARMEVTVPTGVFLPAGLQLAIDGGKAISLPFERCGQGCNASAVLDKAALDGFLKGRILTLHYIVGDQSGANIPVKLDGLKSALSSLAK